ncbi:transposase [Streptococcus infantarius subsp. infantarius]|nr:transposase [Streptococcus infantarius subsp. infantarius]
MKKRYSKEFKETLIAFYHSGQSITQLSKEYDVSPVTIYKWIDLYSKSNESSVSKADFLELKRQLAKVKEERDILKKVLTIFAEKKSECCGYGSNHTNFSTQCQTGSVAKFDFHFGV